MSQQINLFNPIFLKQKKYFSAVAMAQALGMIVVGSVLVTGYANHQVTRQTQEAVQASAQLAEAQNQLLKVKAQYAPLANNNSMQNQIQKLESEVQSLHQVFDILQKSDFGDTKGYSEYFRAFSRQIVDGLWLTNFYINGGGNEIGLQGRALQPDLVPIYITRLKREPVMQGKSFISLEMQVHQTTQPPAKGEAADKTAVRTVSSGYIDFNLQSGPMK